MNKEFDIYEQLNVREDIKNNKEWTLEYTDGGQCPYIFYTISDDIMISIRFLGYQNASLKGMYGMQMLVKMSNIDDNDIIFTKAISKYSRDYFLIRKLRKITLRLHEMKKEHSLNKQRKKTYEKNIKRIPKEYLREKTINDIIN